MASAHKAQKDDIAGKAMRSACLLRGREVILDGRGCHGKGRGANIQ